MIQRERVEGNKKYIYIIMSSLLMGGGFGGVGRGKVWLVEVVVRGGEGLALTHTHTFL